MAFSSYAHFNDLLTCKTVISISPNGQTRFACPTRQVSLHKSSNKIFVLSCGSVQKLAKNYKVWNHDRIRNSSLGVKSLSVRAAATSEKAPKKYPGEAMGFVKEMRHVAMKLHTRDVAKEGTKEPTIQKWEPTIEGYLKFLVDSKLVYDTLEDIVHKATDPAYAEFRNTGLERSENLAKDLEWFRQQGYSIPGPSSPGTSYAKYLQNLSEQDPSAFICHFYNFYFAHTAGGRMIGKKVAEKIIDGKELEFYKWDGDIKELLNDVREKLNKVAEGWSREERNHCLEETEKSFAYSGELLGLIIS